jgi:hypothetical protein
MSRSAISKAENLFDFFHHQVDEAVNHRRAQVSEEGVYYLTHLLVEKGKAAEGPRSTLVELRMKAAQQPGAQALNTWRELGDEALYTSGFFQAHLERRALSLEYYAEMGASAYAHAANLLRSASGRSAGRGIEQTFAELAQTFEACIGVLREVKESVRASTDDTSDAAVLRLYQEWLATGSRASAERLRQLGVVPIRPASGKEPAC